MYSARRVVWRKLAPGPPASRASQVRLTENESPHRVRTPFVRCGAVLDFAKQFCARKFLRSDCRWVELRALCNDSPQTPPGPEGSNGSGSVSCAAEYPKFLWSRLSGWVTKRFHDIQGYCAEVPPANIQRDCGAAARYPDAGERDPIEPRGACVHFFRRARRGENHQRADSGEGLELREGGDGWAGW